MAVVNINVDAYSNPPLYNAIQLAFYNTDDVCYKTKHSYQIDTINFEEGSLIYKLDNSNAVSGWYSDGHNRALWDGFEITDFIPCEVNWEPSGQFCEQIEPIGYKPVTMSDISDELTPTDACTIQSGLAVTRYHSGENVDPIVGDTIFNDIDGLSNFNGNAHFWKFDNEGIGFSAMKVSTTGVVIQIDTCS